MSVKHLPPDAPQMVEWPDAVRAQWKDFRDQVRLTYQPLNADGFTLDGVYWGPGLKVWQLAAVNGSLAPVYFRCRNKDTSRQAIKQLAPRAWFYRNVNHDVIRTY